jgi:hypothetical protein
VKPIDENLDEDADEGAVNPRAARADPDGSMDLNALLATFKLSR